MPRLHFVLVALLVTLNTALAHAEATYSALIDQAIAAQTDGAFERAHELFARAHELSPSARTLRGMGVTSFQLGRYRRAVEELDGALAHAARPLAPELRESVAALRTRASAAIAVLRLELLPSGAELETLLVDNVPHDVSATHTVPLDPGLHVLRLAAAGYEAHQQTVMLAPGGQTTVRVSLVRADSPTSPHVKATMMAPAEVSVGPRAEGPPPPHASPAEPRASSELSAILKRRRAGIALLSSAIALGALSGGMYALGTARIEHVRRLCEQQPGGKCTPAERDEQLEEHAVHRLEHTVTALLAGSIAASATSFALFIWNAKARRARNLQVGALPRGLFLRGAF